MQPEGPEVAKDRTFSPVPGGPFYRLLCRLRLERRGEFVARRPVIAGWAITWGVMALLGIDGASAAHVDPVLVDYAVVGRLLLGIPLFFAFESVLHVRAPGIVWRLAHGDYAAGDGAVALERALRRAERLRDGWVVELALLALVIAFAVSSMWMTSGVPAPLAAAGARRVTAAGAWYVLVALPLFQFLFLRGLWRWTIWSLWLFDLSRIPLQLMPTHPDRAGGLAFLGEATPALAVFGGGVSAAVAGTWESQFVRYGADVNGFAMPLAALLLVTLLLAFGPLVWFWPNLMRSRLQGLRDYGHLALVYNRMFHRRWVEGPTTDALLGAPDIQSLADMQNAYGCMAQMRLVPFERRMMLVVIAGTLIPMLPLIALAVPLRELLLRLAQTMFFGLAGPG